MTRLRVWYGLRKLTAKAVRKPSIIVIYENESYWRTEIYAKRMMEVLHERYQTDEEMEDAKGCTRIITVYEMFFLDDKRFKKSPLLAVEHNFKADENNVSLEEREIIKKKLLDKVYRFYNIAEPKNLQLQLF